MSDMFTASTSKGKLTITENAIRLKIPGSSERTILRSAITEVRIGLGVWYFVGFMRNLTLIVVGEKTPLVLGNMRKSKALEARRLLGF